MRKTWLLVILLSLLSAACRTDGTPARTTSEPEFPVTISSGDAEVTIEKRPERIVSLSSTATEILFAIEAGEQVEAVDDQSNYPAEAPKSDLSGFQPNVEAIAARNPDLVIYHFDPGDLADSLEKLGIPALMQPAAVQLEDTYQQISDLGLATGKTEEAEDLVESMKKEITEVLETVPEFEDPPTYYHELEQTYFTLTSKTFAGEIYSLLGLENIADAADTEGSGYPQLSAEYIIDADPDFIFLANTKCCAQSSETVAQRPGWGNMKAVTGDRVVELDDDVASRWGPRVVDFLEAAAEAVSEPEPANA